MHTSRLLSLVGLPLSITVGASAQTVLLDENFDGKTQGQFASDWTPGPALIADPSDPNATAIFPDLPTTAAFHPAGPVAEWNGFGTVGQINPTETQSIRLSFDFWDDAVGNKRVTMGLRGAGPTENLIEVGMWNANTLSPLVLDDPETPDVDESLVPTTGYGFRTILFPQQGEQYVRPFSDFNGYGYFQLDPTKLDGGEEPDGIVGPADIGQGWHRYVTTITPDSITFELDLFRDGLMNERDSEGDIVGGAAGFDATTVIDVTSGASGYDSLRFGSPSGISAAPGGGGLFDNILLELIDAVVIDGVVGDYDNSGLVEQSDLNLVLTNWGTDRTFSDPGGTEFGSLLVDQEELNLVLTNWGSSSAPSFEGSAVPEPGTLALLGGLALAGLRRRK
ncbi:MAG: PEP-CTERM sorting domain-containing protein [Planctomycetota bacterium]